MKYLSVCSGIDAATVAWHPLGWEAAAYSEIEKFPSQVLAHHYPNTPNLGDMTKFKEWNLGTIDLIVGGTPCQSFSVAGLRKGLDDPRGNLMLTFLAIADKYRPRWVVWENVPGVLSSNAGKDFGTFLGALGHIGYGFAYRVLDAQYFGVAQRRKRVFVVGHLGDWRRAAAVLFERHSLSRDSAPSRDKGQKTSKNIGAGAVVGGLCARTGLSNSAQDAAQGHLLPIPFDTTQITSASNFSKPESGDPCHPLAATAHPPAIAQPVGVFQDSEYGVAQYDSAGTLRAGRIPEHQMVIQPMIVHGTQDPCVSDVAFAQGRNNGGENVLIQSVGTNLYNGSITGEVATALTTKLDGTCTGPTVMQTVYELHSQDSRVRELKDVCTTVSATYGTGGGNVPITLKSQMAVRRLTPVECERLQGFPDHYTDIKPKGKPTPDGPRYKALGNSMAVPVMAWIGKQIQMVEGLDK